MKMNLHPSKYSYILASLLFKSAADIFPGASLISAVLDPKALFWPSHMVHIWRNWKIWKPFDNTQRKMQRAGINTSTGLREDEDLSMAPSILLQDAKNLNPGV
jgi:hypothetical protein